MESPDESRTLSLRAEKLIAGGAALARLEDGPVVFVDGALPGELVEASVVSIEKGIRRARVERVIEGSPERVDPPCPAFHAGCGGCQLQYAKHDAQMQMKLDIVKESLQRIAKTEPDDVIAGGSVSAFDYRTTLHMAVVDGVPSLHQRGSSNTVPIDECLIAHPTLRDLVQQSRLPGASDATFRVSISTGERVAWIRPAISKARIPKDVTVTIDGTNAAITEKVAGMDFRVSARSFFQSGPAAAELVARTVLELTPQKVDWLLDAYSGVGVLGALVASSRGCRLTAVENSRSSVKDARINLAELEAEVLKAEVATLTPGQTTPDCVVADPARPGLGKSAAKALASMRAANLILVSCDPASFARDVGLLAEYGYRRQQTKVLDLFPQTHHVEMVSSFVLDV